MTWLISLWFWSQLFWPKEKYLHLYLNSHFSNPFFSRLIIHDCLMTLKMDICKQCGPQIRHHRMQHLIRLYTVSNREKWEEKKSDTHYMANKHPICKVGINMFGLSRHKQRAIRHKMLKVISWQSWIVIFTILLAHLSRRLTRWAYRIGLEPASVCPCVRVCVR